MKGFIMDRTNKTIMLHMLLMIFLGGYQVYAMDTTERTRDDLGDLKVRYTIENHEVSYPEPHQIAEITFCLNGCESEEMSFTEAIREISGCINSEIPLSLRFHGFNERLNGKHLSFIYEILRGYQIISLELLSIGGVGLDALMGRLDLERLVIFVERHGRVCEGVSRVLESLTNLRILEINLCISQELNLRKLKKVILYNHAITGSEAFKLCTKLRFIKFAGYCMDGCGFEVDLEPFTNASKLEEIDTFGCCFKGGLDLQLQKLANFQKLKSVKITGHLEEVDRGIVRKCEYVPDTCEFISHGWPPDPRMSECPLAFFIYPYIHLLEEYYKIEDEGEAESEGEAGGELEEEGETRS